MGFEYVDYEVLKEKLLQSIQHLAKKYQHNAQKFIDDYKHNKADANELAQCYVNIPQKRRTQSGLILVMVRCLDASSIPVADKQQILNALVCYELENIFHDYDPERSWKNYFSSFVTNVNNSKFYVSLATSLDLRVDNIPSSAELFVMFSKLKNFMRPYVYIDPSDLRKGLLSANNPFNEAKIDGFEVKTFLAGLTKKIAKLEESVHNQRALLVADERETVEVKQQSVSSSSFGLFAVADTNAADEPAPTNCREAVGNSGPACLSIKVK